MLATMSASYNQDPASTRARWGENERGGERMSEASGRQEMERWLIEKSLEDEDFRQRLLEDPKETLEGELETRLPEEVRVVAVEETADTIYLVLPSSTPTEGRELSDQELGAVAGGWYWDLPPGAVET
jgi:hypothetical protein